MPVRRTHWKKPTAFALFLTNTRVKVTSLNSTRKFPRNSAHGHLVINVTPTRCYPPLLSLLVVCHTLVRATHSLAHSSSQRVFQEKKSPSTKAFMEQTSLTFLFLPSRSYLENMRQRLSLSFKFFAWLFGV